MKKEGVIKFFCTDLKGLHKLEIDLNDDVARVESNRLDLNIVTDIHADETTLLGAWDGVQWESKPVQVVGAVIPGLSGRVDKIAIGKKADADRAVLRFDSKSLGRNGTQRTEHILEFDLKKSND